MPSRFFSLSLRDICMHKYSNFNTYVPLNRILFWDWRRLSHPAATQKSKGERNVSLRLAQWEKFCTSFWAWMKALKTPCQNIRQEIFCYFSRYIVGRRVGRTRGRCGNSTGAAKGGTLVNWGGISTSSYILDIIVDFEQVQGVKFYTYLYMHREKWNSGCYVIRPFPL